MNETDVRAKTEVAFREHESQMIVTLLQTVSATWDAEKWPQLGALVTVAAERIDLLLAEVDRLTRELRTESQWQRMYADHVANDRVFLRQVADALGIRTDEVTVAYLERLAEGKTE